jgi:hypothetical protein
MKKPPAIPSESLALMAEIGPCWRDDIPGQIRAMLDGFAAVLKDGPKERVKVRSGRYGKIRGRNTTCSCRLGRSVTGRRCCSFMAAP